MPSRRCQRLTRRVVLLVSCLLLTGPFAGAQLSLLAPLDTDLPVTYHIATGEPGSAYRASDRELAEWALAAWQRAANGVLRLAPADESEARLRIYWVPASAGQYGEMRPLEVDGQRGAAVYIRPDMQALGAAIAASAADDPLLRETIVYLTCLHELGHALGLEHTAHFADVMYFFGYGGDIPEFFRRYRRQLERRADIENAAGLSAGDLAQLATLYPVSSAAAAPAR